MTRHMTGTRKEWLAARLGLLKEEKELTRRSDELARRRQELPWVRIDKEYRLETDEGSASLADLFKGRSQLLVYHFMFGPDYKAGCPSCSSIADGFDGIAVHLANHDVALSVVSRAPLAKLQAYKQRMGWNFPWASSLGSDFNADFNVSFTAAQQREGTVEYNYQRAGHAMDAIPVPEPVAQFAATCGTDAPTYSRDRPGLSTFVLEDGVVYHTYSTYARGLDGLWGMYQWLDRAPKRAQRDGRLVSPPRRVRQALSRVVGAVGATGGRDISRRMVSERASQRAFFGVSALLFAASAAVTIAWCASMSAMGELPMPGGWTMSMAWTLMCGQTWPEAAASFLGMWVVMMVAMMLPSLVPALWGYRQAVGRTGETRLGRLTVPVGVGYFFVWTVFGMAVFPLGVALAEVVVQLPPLARAVPIADGVAVLIAGALQFTAWKAHHLVRCREAPGRGRALPADAGTAVRHGLRLGLHCSYSCAGLTAILLVIGVMDLRAMAAVTAAITVERLAPAGERVARVTGAVAVGAGLFLIARAAGLG